MPPLTALVLEGQRVNLRVARQSQALVIEGMAKVAGTGPAGRPRLMRRVWRLQLDLAGILAGDPAQLLDSVYVHAQRLVSLHQEFAHRVLEVIDADDLPTEDQGPGADVIPLLGRRGSQ